MTERFGWRGLVARVLFSGFVVFAVWNPSGESYWHWVVQGSGGFWPKAAVGLGLLFVHGTIWLSLLSALRWRGVILLSLLLLATWQSLAALAPARGGDSVSAGTAILTGLALLYAAGLSWSHIHHRIAGLVHLDKS